VVVSTPTGRNKKFINRFWWTAWTCIMESMIIKCGKVQCWLNNHTSSYWFTALLLLLLLYFSAGDRTQGFAHARKSALPLT
jgi:hypothetical protein